MYPPSHLKAETDQFSEMLFPSYLEFRTIDKIYKPSTSKNHAIVRSRTQTMEVF
jgi:hypothetical protein